MSEDLIIVQNLIYEIRGQKVMLDSDLARLYGIETRELKQAVRRNLKRFPADFMIELDLEEYHAMKACSRSQIVTLDKKGRGTNVKYKPFVFTELGVAMLSSVLFFFQFNGRIRPGGLQGLPEDGSERKQYGQQGGSDEDPPITRNMLGIVLQEAFANQHGQRDGDQQRDSYPKHIGPYSPASFRPDRAAEDLPDGYTLGIGVSIVGAHRHKRQQRQQDRDQAENLHEAHIAPHVFMVGGDQVFDIAIMRPLEIEHILCSS